VSSEFWATLQQFDFTGAGAAERVVTALPLLLALFAWLIASAVLLRAGARKVEAL